MKVILSEEYEKQRLLNRCGAPVSKELYSKEYIGNIQNAGNGLPYADVMQAVEFGNKADRPNKIYFPFHRTQIKEYLDVSAVLFDLVRNVMRIQVENEAILKSSMAEEGKEDTSLNQVERETIKHYRKLRGEMRKEIGQMVELAFSRMKQCWSVEK